MRHANDDRVLERLHEYLPSDDPPSSREEFRQRYINLLESFGLEDEAQTRWLDGAEVPILEVTVTDVPAERSVIYVHGGGLTAGSAWSYRDVAARLARAARARVLVVDFRLSPEVQMADTLEDCVAGYLFASQAFPDQPVAIAGDSAGAGMALTLAITLRDREAPRPSAVVGWSPTTTRAEFLPSFDTNAETDPYVTKRDAAASRPAMLRELDPKSVVASPLYSDLAGLPPVQLQVSGTELLLDDSVEFAIKLARSGGLIDLQVIPGLVHVWHTFAAIFPEGQASIERAGRFLIEQDQRAEHR